MKKKLIYFVHIEAKEKNSIKPISPKKFFASIDCEIDLPELIYRNYQDVKIIKLVRLKTIIEFFNFLPQFDLSNTEPLDFLNVKEYLKQKGQYFESNN